MHNDILITRLAGVPGPTGHKGKAGVNPSSDGRNNDNTPRLPGEAGNDTSANSGSCKHKCERALDGVKGADAENGTKGHYGKPGENAPVFILRVGTIPFSSEIIRLLSKGGDGGAGGTGGRGGAGDKGGDAGKNNSKCLKKHSNWLSSGGEGGNGGNGGPGGDGGPAGDGANIYIGTNAPTAVKNKLSSGSQAGEIGKYGEPGEGGPGGQGGLNEQLAGSPRPERSLDGDDGLKTGTGDYGSKGDNGVVTYFPLNSLGTQKS